MRIGEGFDIHRLVEGRRFVMGGVEITHDRGPLGHSDGDALTHAIANALLGAAALGDIGQWFPPGDPEFAGADSLKLLSKVADAVKAAGYRIGNVDSTVMCERPKLSPHYGAMREKLALAMNVDKSQVSVKATTYEQMTEIGRGEAVAAKAIALIS